jgi:hypothetical protein
VIEIESHEDSDDSKITTSSKVSSWGSLDLSSDVEILLKTIGVKENSRSLIVSMYFSSIKNMIQLFNLDLDEIGKLISIQDLREAVIQDSIIILLCQGKCLTC